MTAVCVGRQPAHSDGRLCRDAGFVPAAVLLIALVGCPGARRAPRIRTPERPPAVAVDRSGPTGVRLGRLADAAMRLGGRLAQRPIGTLLIEGQREAFEIALAGARCHLLVGLGAPNVTDLDLSLHELGGMQLAQDSARDAFPSVRFCPPRDVRAFVVLSAYQGTGEAVLADLELPRDAMLDVSRALGEERPLEPPEIQPGVPMPPTAEREPTPDRPGGAPAEQALEAESRSLLELGYVAVGEPLSGSLVEGAITAHAVMLGAGSCYALVAAGDVGVRDLDLRLLDPSGAEVSRDTAADPAPRVRACPSVSGPFRLEVRMFAGAGRYVGRLLLLSSLTGVPSSLPSAVRQRYAELTGVLRGRGFAPLGPAIRGGLFYGGRQLHELWLRRDRCYAVAAASVADGDLDLFLWAPDGSSLGSDTAEDSAPSVLFCPHESMTVDLEVRLYRARAEYVLGVFVSPPDGEST